MITRPLKVYGRAGGRNTADPTSLATPEHIDEIGKPAIHLISGSTGVGKSNVARNVVEAYWQAHAKAGTDPHPEVLVFTGAPGDPVWGGRSKHVKMFSPQTSGEFVDEVNRRYDRAMRAKSELSKDPAGGKAAGVPDLETVAALGGGRAHEREDQGPHRPTMVVIDDEGASELFPQQMFRSPLAQPIQSHRHSDMSFVISSQRYHSHNPWLRSNASTVSVFPPKGAEETNFLKRDLPLPADAMRRGFAVAAANGKHNFVHVDMRERHATHGFTGHPI